MKHPVLRPIRVLFVALFLGLAISAHGIDPDLGRFCAAKQEQIRAYAQTLTNKVPPLVWKFFDAVRVDDWETATNLSTRINSASRRYLEGANDESMSPALSTLIWPPISESYGAYEEYHNWDAKWLHRFGKEIIDSIPRGSIYFGGTDPGRFVVSVMCESQVEGKPFFTLTQNQLVDGAYLDYLRAMYGKKIRVPSTNDAQQAFQEYMTNALERSSQGKLKPDENVREVNGRVQVSGTVAVMTINGLLARKIFESNSGHEFFLEESYSIDWMYPYLAPHKLIMKLERTPVAQLSSAQVAEDQNYWKKLSSDMLGDWLTEKTSLKELCDFTQKYGLGKNPQDFKGDKAFAENRAARQAFGKLRGSFAALYAWRMEQAKDADEREAMYQAADLAYRQSYAICPTLTEAVYGFATLLSNRQRNDDAILVAKTSLQLSPDNKNLQHLVSEAMKH